MEAKKKGRSSSCCRRVILPLPSQVPRTGDGLVLEQEVSE